MSIENSDLLDDGLQAVMGKERCQDISGSTPKKRKATKEDPVDASWVPVRENGWMDRLKACVKSAGPIGAVSCVVFWWQQTGRLDAATAFWALIVLGFLAGLSLGKYVLQ